MQTVLKVAIWQGLHVSWPELGVLLWFLNHCEDWEQRELIRRCSYGGQK